MMREWDLNLKHNHYTSSVWGVAPRKGRLFYSHLG